jgi:hypothetical protein
MYKLIKNPITEQINYVLKDGVLNIPFDPANTDYQAYLLWLAEGGVPLEADTP